jgi:hypothetical protein
LEEVGFRVRLNARRAASRSTMAFGTFYDIVIRLSTESDVDLDALIEHIQHLLSSDKLPPTPRMGKVMLDDGTEYAFPLDEPTCRSAPVLVRRTHARVRPFEGFVAENASSVRPVHLSPANVIRLYQEDVK